MVRLLQNLGSAYRFLLDTFNPTMVRLLQGDATAETAKGGAFQSHNGAIAAR